MMRRDELPPGAKPGDVFLEQAIKQAQQQQQQTVNLPPPDGTTPELRLPGVPVALLIANHPIDPARTEIRIAAWGGGYWIVLPLAIEGARNLANDLVKFAAQAEEHQAAKAAGGNGKPAE